MEELYGATRPGGHTGDDRPPRYLEDDVVVYRASGWKECDVAFVAGAMGLERSPHPQFLLDAFREGDEYEPLILARLSGSLAIELIGGGQVSVKLDAKDEGEQIRLEMELGEINDRRVIVRMHLDGTGAASWLGHPTLPAMVGADVVVEVKKLGPDYWRKFLKGGYRGLGLYDAQISAQMLASGKPVLFVCGEKTPNGLGRVVAEIITEPPISLREFRKVAARREAMIEAAGHGGGLPECPEQKFPCPVWYLHEGEDGKGAKTREKEAGRVEGDEELVRLVSMRNALDTAKKQTDDELKLVKASIEKWLEGHGAKATGATVEFDGAVWDVTFTRVDKKEYTVSASVQEYVQVKARKPTVKKPVSDDPFDGVNGGVGTAPPASRDRVIL